ncbi:hypothetical protein [Kordia sp.]|uniref:hypothetical protein n=1 Tax=Kordia sp. TaxID=1965332 RepID=UPI003D6AECB5
MKRQLLLSFFLLAFVFSCTKTVTKTIVEKEIVYLQKVNDSLQEVSISKSKIASGKIHFKIEKIDSLVTYLSPENGHRREFKKMQKKYNLDDSFKGEYLQLDDSYTYTKSATVAHERINFYNTYDTRGHVIKKLVQQFRNIYFEGGRSKKHTIQIFSRSENEEMTKPTYEVVAYGDRLDLYEEEGYFLAIEYGCCTSTSTYNLLDLKGNSVLKSNDIIKSIITKDNHYLISSLKNEVYDAPTIVIQNKDKGKQYVSFSNLEHEMNYSENYLIKLKDQNKPKTGFYDIPLAAYELKNLDDLEIWIPFGKADTLKIPFKNEKAFGVDYPQIKVSLPKAN